MTKSDAKKEFTVLEWSPTIPEVHREVKTVHASWREQAEKLAEALRQFETSGYGWQATEALEAYEKWKEGKK